jgi:hypothetical protein
MRTSVLLTMVRYLRQGSSGESEVAPRSKALPVVGGAHRCSVRPKGEQPAAPCTISRQRRRAGSAAAATRPPTLRSGAMASR